MPKEIRASHILVKTEAEANELLFDLKRRASFAETAQKRSICPSKSKGGDLGWFGKGKMVKEFETAAFLQQKNEYAKPVKTQFGWHIILVTDTK